MRLALNDITIQNLKFDTQTRVHDTHLRGFGITVSKTVKTFFVITGKERRLTTLGRYPEMSLKEARTRAKAVQVAKTTESPSSTSSTFLEASRAFQKAIKGRVKPATLDQYAYYLDMCAFSKSLDAITKADVNEKLAQFDGKPTAQNYAFVTLRNFFNWSLTEGLVKWHPLVRAKPPNRLKSRDRVLTDDELRAIWRNSSKTKFGTVIRLLMLTGLRRMELMRAEFGDELLRVAETKNGTEHFLPITPLVRELLPVPVFNDWSRAKDRFDKHCPIDPWRVHDLRRTLATNMQRLGIGEHIIERILNHTQGGVKAVYQRYKYQAEVREALLTYEAHIIKITQPGYNPSRRDGSPQELSDANTEQARLAP